MSVSEVSEFGSSSTRIIADDEQTLIYGSDEESARVSPDALRALLDLPQGDRIQNYGRLTTIGIGGEGAVFAASEPGLNREVALKILRPRYRNNSDRVESFIREARATAQIDHPNIIPVHRLGVFDDVGVYFSMKRVEGETLRAILRELDENRNGYRRKYSQRRLLEIFMGICNGVAFAHRHGILHGDLKPSNVMIGEYGEVLVMDWGMACYRPELDQGGRRTKENLDLPESLSADKSMSEKQLGGTPGFMAPEQFSGEAQQPTELSDIYGLGAILYTILTWKVAPFDVEQGKQKLMEMVVRGHLVPPHRTGQRVRPIPRELEAICLKAMSRNRSDRYQHVTELLSDVLNYLDGFPVMAYSPNPIYRIFKLIRRHPLIPSVLLAATLTWFGYYGVMAVINRSRVRSQISLAEFNYVQAREFSSLALRTARALRSNPPDGDIDRENRLMTELIRQIAEMENGYNSALEYITLALDVGRSLPRAEEITQDIFKSTLELYRQVGSEQQLEGALRQFRGRWGLLFDKAIAHDAELTGLVAGIDSQSGLLLLDTEGALGDWSVEVEPAYGKDQGKGVHELPFRGVLQLPLSAGTYLLNFRRVSDGTEFSAPALVRIACRTKLDLELPTQIPEDMGYIPGGEFQHQSRSGVGEMRSVYLPSYLMRKYEVTLGEYIEFWKSLADPELRKRYLGWYRFDLESGESRPLWDEAGKLHPRFSRKMPVVGISGEAAMAYCRWLGEKQQCVVRLPTRYEWEKAARGVDGRLYVWGDEYQPGRALLNDNLMVNQYPMGAPVGSFRQDVSPYGIFDLTGNVREFVRNPVDSGILFMTIGGSLLCGAEMARCSEFSYISGGSNDVGFRYVMELPRSEAKPQ